MDLGGLAGDLNGLNSSSMIHGGDFDGAKAYKDSKVCNMLTMQEFHRHYHEVTGICSGSTSLCSGFSSLPPFHKYITRGYVLKRKLAIDMHRLPVIQALQNQGFIGAGTRILHPLKTSCRKKPVIQIRRAKYGRSVKTSSDWLEISIKRTGSPKECFQLCLVNVEVFELQKAIERLALWQIVQLEEQTEIQLDMAPGMI